MPDTPIEIAAGRAETLRRQLEGNEIKYGGERVRVTASFGVAQYGPYTADPSALMKAVDAAMYAAKAAGRNRVVMSALSGLVGPPQASQPAAVARKSP